MTPARATARSRAPTRSACRALDPQPRRSTSGRRAVRQRTTNSDRGHHRHDPDRAEPAPVADEGDEQLAPGQVAQQVGRLHHRQRPGHERDEQQGHAEEVGYAAGPGRVVAAADPGQCRRQDEPDGEVDREDAAPVGVRHHDGAEQRAEHAAELLHGRDHAERHAAALDGVEVRDEGQRGRDQPAAADALEEPAGDQARQVVGQRGDQRPEREEDERGDQHGQPAAQVGDPADQRQHRDVPEQEAGDDRRRPLELVERDAGRGHHLGQGQHDDVGVGGGEGHRDRSQAEQPAGPGRRRGRPGLRGQRCPSRCRSRRTRSCRSSPRCRGRRRR